MTILLLLVGLGLVVLGADWLVEGAVMTALFGAYYFFLFKQL